MIKYKTNSGTYYSDVMHVEIHKAIACFNCLMISQPSDTMAYICTSCLVSMCNECGRYKKSSKVILCISCEEGQL